MVTSSSRRCFSPAKPPKAVIKAVTAKMMIPGIELGVSLDAFNAVARKGSSPDTADVMLAEIATPE